MDKNNNYIIKGPLDNNNTVELWSTKRLPFEPKDWLYDMKNKLKKSIKSIEYKKDHVLHSQLHTKDEGFFDVENVLTYNVGTGAFAHLCEKGLCFERTFIDPIENSDSFKYYHSYGLVNAIKSEYWEKETDIAKWMGVSFEKLDSSIKPHDIWYQMKNADIDFFNKPKDNPYYAMNIKINVDANSKINIASAMKPFLDGIISSFHAHDGTNIDIVSSRIAEKLNKNETIIKEMLLDSKSQILGTTKVLLPFGQGVQWHPDDDKFVYIAIEINKSESLNNYTYDVELYTVKK